MQLMDEVATYSYESLISDIYIRVPEGAYNSESKNKSQHVFV